MRRTFLTALVLATASAALSSRRRMLRLSVLTFSTTCRVAASIVPVSEASSSSVPTTAQPRKLLLINRIRVSEVNGVKAFH